MKVYRVEVETEGREVYYVQAETEQQAHDLVATGDLDPSVSEVLSGTITSVEEADE